MSRRGRRAAFQTSSRLAHGGKSDSEGRALSIDRDHTITIGIMTRIETATTWMLGGGAANTALSHTAVRRNASAHSPTLPIFETGLVPRA